MENRMKRFFSLMIIFLLLAGVSAAQNPLNENLKNRHSISINGGIKGNSRSEVSGNTVMLNMKSGFTGGIDYGYWFNDDWQMGLSLNLVEASMDLNFGNMKSHAVISFLAGFKWYPESLKLGEAGRIFLGAYAGPVIGFGLKEQGIPMVSQNITETVVGGQLIAGADIFIARWFKIGPAVNYNFMADFKEITGINKNFSGIGFVFGFGFVL